MDVGSTLHQRRQWVSQNPLEQVKENCIPEGRHRTPFRTSSVKDGVKFIRTHPVGSLLSCLIVGLMVLNLNQGPILHGYVSSQKIHNSSHEKPLRTLERVVSDNGCKKTPFVTPHEATYSVPLTPPWYSGQLPSHIELCQELINRNDYVTRLAKDQSGGLRSGTTFDKYVVRESPILCQDWSKPHSALMQLISSSIIAYVGERFGLEYHHGCHKLIEAEYIRGLEFDVTTAQQVFPELRLPIDQRVTSLGEVVHDLCNNCIQEYNSNGQEFGSFDATHHCLAFPNRGPVTTGLVSQQIQGRNGMPEMIEVEETVDSQGNVFHSALESVLPLIRNRIWHQARDWQVEAMIPRGDPLTGAVIFFDAGQSLPIPFHLYRDYIPQDTTRIDIISGPNCASGNLAISMSRMEPLSCLEHLTELREYLQNFAREFGVDVAFTLVSSTATQYTRMTQTSTLICPPETLSCLLPTLAKERTKNALIFESPESSTAYWFDSLGKAVQNIEIVRLTHDQMVMDREQQYIEAKFEGFSTDQVVGRAPPGMNRPDPMSAILGDTPSEDTRGRSNVDSDSSLTQPGFHNNLVQDDTSLPSGDAYNQRSESNISYGEGTSSEHSTNPTEPVFSFDSIINDKPSTSKKNEPAEIHIRTDLLNKKEDAVESAVNIGNIIETDNSGETDLVRGKVTSNQEHSTKQLHVMPPPKKEHSVQEHSTKQLHVMQPPKKSSNEYELIIEDEKPSEVELVYDHDSIFDDGNDDKEKKHTSYRKQNYEDENKLLWGSSQGEPNSGMSLHGASSVTDKGNEVEVNYKSYNSGMSLHGRNSARGKGNEGGEVEVSYKSMGGPSNAVKEGESETSDEMDVDIDYNNLFGNWR